MGFFDSFTGAAQRRDLRRADQMARGDLQRGYDDSMRRYDQAFDLFAPFAREGQRANAFYNDALGLNGDEARAAAQGVITSDPMFQGAMGQDSNAVLRQLNARGASGGGQAQLAGQRVLQQNYGNWLDRYRQAGAQGFQAAGQQAGVRMGQGDNAYGFGATKANMAVQRGNALASSRGMGINNLLNLAGTAAKAYAGMK